MTRGKRAFDLGVGVALGVVLFPLFCLLVLMVLIVEGCPVFYVSERMKAPDMPFNLIKFRTMKSASGATNTGVSGGDKSGRIGAFGRLLRQSRLDELPQLINIIKGDMSFVGPRPPLREYTDDYPEVYSKVLACRPGVTGLATLVFHAHEEKLLAACKNAAETDRTYRRRCIPRKARLDLIYARNRNLRLDLWLLWRTCVKIFTAPKPPLP